MTSSGRCSRRSLLLLASLASACGAPPAASPPAVAPAHNANAPNANAPNANAPNANTIPPGKPAPHDSPPNQTPTSRADAPQPDQGTFTSEGTRDPARPSRPPSRVEKAAALSKGELDHPKGTPLTGYCDISKVPWKEKPEVLGMARLTRFEDVAEAERGGVRSYVIVKSHYADLDKDKVSDFAMIVTRHFAPTGDGTLFNWAEVSTLIVRDCTVHNTEVLILSTPGGFPTEPR